ncbi:MAG: hypothetical protein QNK20_13290 [Aureibaculum sp.]|nr:hypothetical protein [Aureibaculum sp.]
MSNSASSINPNAQASGGLYRVGLGAATGLSPLLEQKIIVLAEANADMQTEAAQGSGILDPLTSKAVADVYGYGSPAHLASIVFFDNLSAGVPIRFLFVPESGTGTVTAFVMTGTGATVTKTGVLTINFNGTLISVTLSKDETLAQALANIKTAINAELNLPCLVSTAAPTTSISIDSKWKGQSSVDLAVSVYSNSCEGITFAEVKTDGTGQVVPTSQLVKFQNDWYPHVLNCLGNGISNTILDEFESFNGTPSGENGKYTSDNMTPAIFYTGTHEELLVNLQAVTEGRLDFNTNSYVAVPNAQDLTFVNAANELGMFVKKSNGDPKQDILDDLMAYSTPPEDNDVGDIIDYSFRNECVKAGCSTVNFKDGNYYAQDLITTYHPQGETDPIFRYVRDNMLVFNLIDQFKKFNEKQKNKTIAPNALPSARITSPALYKAGILNQIIRPFVNAGFIADFDYAKENLDVGINPTNAGRFDIVSPNLITSLLRIIAVEVTVNKYNI